MKLFMPNKSILIVNAISVMVAFLIHLPEMIALSDMMPDEVIFPGMHWTDVFNEVFFTYLSLLLLFFLNERLFRFGDTQVNMGWKKLLLSFLVTWIASNLLGKGFVALHQHFDIPAIDALLHHYLHPLRDFLISVVVTGSCYLMYQNRKSNMVLLENQQLRTENIANQYETLKNQLNPHMLFNSLNTLSTLIRESSDKAQDYLQELSRVLRYTLQDNDSHSVTLAEEMDFVHAYLYLLKMRYEENLNFGIRISSDALQKKLPPMAVQMLVENAVKHNEISRRHPLTVAISTSGDWITVENRIQPKLTGNTGTRIGLDNLAKRYRLLFKQEIVVKEENSCFIVRLPLI